jgi:hypothetical protein
MPMYLRHSTVHKDGKTHQLLASGPFGSPRSQGGAGDPSRIWVSWMHWAAPEPERWRGRSRGETNSTSCSKHRLGRPSRSAFGWSPALWRCVVGLEAVAGAWP